MLTIRAIREEINISSLTCLMFSNQLLLYYSIKLCSCVVRTVLHCRCIRSVLISCIVRYCIASTICTCITRTCTKIIARHRHSFNCANNHIEVLTQLFHNFTSLKAHFHLSISTFSIKCCTF